MGWMVLPHLNVAVFMLNECEKGMADKQQTGREAPAALGGAKWPRCWQEQERLGLNQLSGIPTGQYRRVSSWGLETHTTEDQTTFRFHKIRKEPVCQPFPQVGFWRSPGNTHITSHYSSSEYPLLQTMLLNKTSNIKKAGNSLSCIHQRSSYVDQNSWSQLNQIKAYLMKKMCGLFSKDS